MSVDSEISSTIDLFGKTVDELQEDIVIGDDSISGTLHYIDDYTGFSSDVSLQTGNYIVLHAETDVDGAQITATVTNQTVLDSDGIVILRIADKDSQNITFVASKDGYETATKTYSLTDLVCEVE